jgi:hypothetical protein
MARRRPPVSAISGPAISRESPCRAPTPRRGEGPSRPGA